MKLFLLAGLAALMCTPAPAPPPDPVPVPVPAPTASSSAPEPDPVPDASVAHNCANVCAHLTALKCADAAPTDGGATCADVCLNVQHSGTISYPFTCVLAAKTCAASDKCFR